MEEKKRRRVVREEMKRRRVGLDMNAPSSEGFVGAPEMSDLRALFREANRAMSKRSREVEKQT